MVSHLLKFLRSILCLGFTLKNYSSVSCTFLTNWTNVTIHNLELEWPFWGIFDLLKLAFLRTKLEGRECKIKHTEWDAYFICSLEASKCDIQDSKITSLQSTISKLSKAHKQKKFKKVLRPFPPLPSHLSLSLPPLYHLIPHSNSLTELSFFGEPLPAPSFSSPLEAALLKSDPLRILMLSP